MSQLSNERQVCDGAVGTFSCLTEVNSSVPALGSTHLCCDQQVSCPALTKLYRYCFWQQLCCWPLRLYFLVGTKVAYSVILCSGRPKIFDFQQQKFVTTVVFSFAFKETNSKGFNLFWVYATATNMAHSTHKEASTSRSQKRHISGFHIVSFYHSFHKPISYYSPPPSLCRWWAVMSFSVDWMEKTLWYDLTHLQVWQQLLHYCRWTR